MDSRVTPWMWVNNQIKTIYFENPKVCSTSLKSMLELSANPEWKHVQTTFNTAEPKYKDYFKFGFVRNPWSRIASGYRYYKHSPGPCQPEKGSQIPTQRDWTTWDFSFFIENIYKKRYLNKHWDPQLSYVPIDKMTIDFVGKFENFKEDWEYVKTQIQKYNPKFGGDIVHIMPENQKKKKYDYKEMYGEELKQKVKQHYIKDINAFQYEF